MKGIVNYLSISNSFHSTDEITFKEGSFIIYSTNVEERSYMPVSYQINQSSLRLIEIVEDGLETFSLDLDDNRVLVNLRSNTDFDRLVAHFENATVYLDITGLTHSSWAWLIDMLLKRKSGETFALYSEPDEYKFNENPIGGQIFDLSKRILGISPLPRFAKFFQYRPDNFIFMPLLGFEGARLAHLWEDIQPLKENTYPVFGVPGFSYSYPFYSYQANKLVLTRESIWHNRRYEKANCPVSIFILGSSIISDNPEKILRIALLGTKPHALGAVLLKLTYPNRVDLIYDHPIRQSKRTTGRSKTLCYALDVFREKLDKK